MRRYDDRRGNTRLYVGRLSSRTRARDLENLFSRYGRVRDVDLKHDYAFVEFSDSRDADDARYSLNGREFDGSRITVEFSKGGSRGSGAPREYLGRGPPPGSGRCFNCGIDGHWARDCKAGDWKNKCYRCGERGHIERNCKNSPKNLKRGRSLSRSPRHGRSRSRSFSRSRSYSRSRSPPRKVGRGAEREDKRSRSPQYSRSPKPKKSPPPSKGRNRSPSLVNDSSPRERSPARRQALERNGSDYSTSPKNNSRSPSREEQSPVSRRYGSPKESGHSPSPIDNRNPVAADDDDNNDRGYGRGSESPSSN